MERTKGQKESLLLVCVARARITHSANQSQNDLHFWPQVWFKPEHSLSTRSGPKSIVRRARNKGTHKVKLTIGESWSVWLSIFSVTECAKLGGNMDTHLKSTHWMTQLIQLKKHETQRDTPLLMNINTGSTDSKDTAGFFVSSVHITTDEEMKFSTHELIQMCSLMLRAAVEERKMIAK